MKKTYIALALGVGVALMVLGGTFPPAKTAVAQSGSRTQQGSGARQQGSASRQQGSTTFQQGSSVRQQGSSVRQQGSGTVQQGSAARQQGSGGVQQGSGRVQQAQPTFEQKMWNFIKSARYDQWAPAGDNGDFRKSDRPHGALVKTYMNRLAAGNPDTLPHGSVLIKENFSPEKKLMAITLMYRSKGYNAEANDWYWIKYNPDGSVATMDTDMGKMKIAGKARGCIECHSGADGDDFSFFND